MRIDFGLIVDGSVVMVENIVRRLGQAREGQIREEVVGWAGREVARPVFFAVMIIIIVYLPILVLQGIEGKMFRPMALTVVFALVASLVLALTLMPLLSLLMFRKRVPHKTAAPGGLVAACVPSSPRHRTGPSAHGWSWSRTRLAASLLLVPFMEQSSFPSSTRARLRFKHGVCPAWRSRSQPKAQHSSSRHCWSFRR